VKSASEIATQAARVRVPLDCRLLPMVGDAVRPLPE
jgi:hypothetical protein